MDSTELVKAIRYCVSGDDECSCGDCPYCETITCEVDLMEKAADAIEQLSMKLHGDEAAIAGMKREIERMVVTGASCWIPVTEKPPLKVGDDGYNGYLVFANGYYEVADYTTDKFDDVPYFHVDGEYEPDVTHWMQLPTPPNGVEDKTVVDTLEVATQTKYGDKNGVWKFVSVECPNCGCQIHIDTTGTPKEET